MHFCFVVSGVHFASRRVSCYAAHRSSNCRTMDQTSQIGQRHTAIHCSLTHHSWTISSRSKKKQTNKSIHKQTLSLRLPPLYPGAHLKSLLRDCSRKCSAQSHAKVNCADAGKHHAAASGTVGEGRFDFFFFFKTIKVRKWRDPRVKCTCTAVSFSKPHTLHGRR